MATFVNIDLYEFTKRICSREDSRLFAESLSKNNFFTCKLDLWLPPYSPFTCSFLFEVMSETQSVLFYFQIKISFLKRKNTLTFSCLIIFTVMNLVRSH